jgi:hypothetical protein
MGDGGEAGMVLRGGRIEIDVPRSLGHFGGIAAAVAVGRVEPPLGVFIAAVPCVKTLAAPEAPDPLRFLRLVTEGAAQPVGSCGQRAVRFADEVDG